MFLSNVTVALFSRCEAVRFAGCWPESTMFPRDATSKCRVKLQGHVDFRASSASWPTYINTKCNYSAMINSKVILQ